eukprot:TRINITY_DN111013_c0_g1_i1.p1 TRINITY_DN111013_c0_g1~~TRINITY_DN111013_c0_g1_i1.p1  ORF type:complete len:325 (+),score=52.42 TRINITY_DN111013_c0_g1_i1:58-975(+)
MAYTIGAARSNLVRRLTGLLGFQSGDRGRGRGVKTAASGLPQRPLPLLLALDLDETLIRVSCDGVHHNRSLRRVNFRVGIDVGVPPKASTFDCSVAIRPGLERFLEWIQEKRQAGLIEGPWIYTTSTPAYTQALLRHLDPGGRIFATRVLTRATCSPSRLPGFFMKDLAKVPSSAESNMQLQRRVLIDNNPVSCVLQPQSSMLVRDWLGDDPADTELARVQETLEAVLESHSDLHTTVCPDQAVDYAGHLVRLTEGHGRWSERLKGLHEQLSACPPKEVAELRKAMRAVSAECNAMKHELLGAAP